MKYKWVFAWLAFLATCLLGFGAFAYWTGKHDWQGWCIAGGVAALFAGCAADADNSP